MNPSTAAVVCATGPVGRADAGTERNDASMR